MLVPMSRWAGEQRVVLQCSPHTSQPPSMNPLIPPPPPPPPPHLPHMIPPPPCRPLLQGLSTGEDLHTCLTEGIARQAELASLQQQASAWLRRAASGARRAAAGCKCWVVSHRRAGRHRPPALSCPASARPAPALLQLDTERRAEAVCSSNLADTDGLLTSCEAALRATLADKGGWAGGWAGGRAGWGVPAGWSR